MQAQDLQRKDLIKAVQPRMLSALDCLRKNESVPNGTIDGRFRL
jgi:hypothetical protein